MSDVKLKVLKGMRGMARRAMADDLKPKGVAVEKTKVTTLGDVNAGVADSARKAMSMVPRHEMEFEPGAEATKAPEVEMEFEPPKSTEPELQTGPSEPAKPEVEVSMGEPRVVSRNDPWKILSTLDDDQLARLLETLGAKSTDPAALGEPQPPVTGERPASPEAEEAATRLLDKYLKVQD